jgi:hypothetical protein
MSAHDDQPTSKSDENSDSGQDGASDGGKVSMTEAVEPDEKHKEKAAELMKSYEYQPTIVLPGSGGAVSGTAVNAWLDEDGNSKHINDEDAPAAKDETGDDEAAKDEASDGQSFEDKIEKDKAVNEKIIKAAEDDEEARKSFN